MNYQFLFKTLLKGIKVLTIHRRADSLSYSNVINLRKFSNDYLLIFKTCIGLCFLIMFITNVCLSLSFDLNTKIMFGLFQIYLKHKYAYSLTLQ